MINQMKIFAGSWNPNAKIPIANLNLSDPLITRKWQKDACRSLKDTKFPFIGCPTGSGKSLFQKMDSNNRLNKGRNKKVLIAVPQTTIARGFDDVEYKYGRVESFIVDEALIIADGKDTINRLKTFLSTPQVNKEQRVCIITHATLSQLFESITEKQKHKLFKDVFLWVDEAHHISWYEFKEHGKINQEYNRLGSVVDFFMKNGCSGVGLATATPFRGDNRHILSEEMLSKFKKFTIGYDKYVEECCKDLSGFSYSFSFFKDLYFESVKDIFKEDPFKKTIIFIPSVTSEYSIKNKKEAVFRIIKAINPRLVTSI
jgi:superfamily II DNA or RNA helicase